MSAKNRAAASLGKKGGRAKSPAKTAAAQANGKKGGRPANCPSWLANVLAAPHAGKQWKTCDKPCDKETRNVCPRCAAEVWFDMPNEKITHEDAR